ncbi:myrosinase 1-like [Thrips palmi]|uniref:Myrosinase 1-like n=1 Tax=Thrips palmi TaxID=161013 RepID=A0A6P8ZU09_THRPL|nr:myrosinase 1-like [Thrips palmi]
MRASAVLLAVGLAVVAVLVRPAEGGLRAKARTLQRKKLALGLGATADTQDCAGQTQRCVDCSTVLQCTRLGQVYRPLRTTACPAATPYCSAGACVATLSDDACIAPPAASTAFTCNGDGYYPDPSNCRRYWLCVAGKAYQYSCNDFAGTVYSQRRAMCVPSSEATCSTVACSNALVGVYQRFPQDPEVYVVCRDAVAANALVAACPPNYTVDAATGDCVLTCLAEGRLADRDNNTRYYECVQTGTNTFSQPRLLMCPEGSTYSADRQRCLSGNEDNPEDPAEPAAKGYNEEYYEPNDNIPESQYDIPAGLLIGAASAAYQVEGAWNESDKSPSIMDVFFHSRPSLANGDVADDSYHKYMDDVQMLSDIQLQFYRFSISWSRVLPQGDSAHPSAVGTQYYNELIDALIARGIQPVITLYHWDLPQVVQDDGGWLNSDIQDKFVDYASYCFQTFGDRVKTWILFNEPMSQCVYGYELPGIAPAVSNPGFGGYLCSHNMIIAHGKAYRAYQQNFAYQGGRLGSAINMEFAEPLTNKPEDVEAAERYRLWRYGWWADPLFFGDYPEVMKNIIGNLSAAEGRATSRLPTFTDEEKTIVQGAMDFLGLNLYTGILVADRTSTETLSAGYFNDIGVETSTDPNWIQSARSSFPVTPFALADGVRWVKNRYNNFPVWVAENGYAGAADEGTKDQKRIGFYSGYMRGLMQAINRDGCNVIGYTCWSLEDNLEWLDGYESKFGLVYVDFNDPNRPRTLKDSAKFFQETLTSRHVSYVKAT